MPCQNFRMLSRPSTRIPFGGNTTASSAYCDAMPAASLLLSDFMNSALPASMTSFADWALAGPRHSAPIATISRPCLNVILSSRVLLLAGVRPSYVELASGYQYISSWQYFRRVMLKVTWSRTVIAGDEVH